MMFDLEGSVLNCIRDFWRVNQVGCQFKDNPLDCMLNKSNQRFSFWASRSSAWSSAMRDRGLAPIVKEKLPVSRECAAYQYIGSFYPDSILHYFSKRYFWLGCISESFSHQTEKTCCSCCRFDLRIWHKQRRQPYQWRPSDRSNQHPLKLCPLIVVCVVKLEQKIN